jgi:TRAP-type uncharacterized transport system fused permease subunit
VPGSLAVATLATCALFATATGIVGAVVTLMGLLAMPQMLKAGYDSRLAAGVVCAGGCLGILIPPSIMLIVYAAQAGISVVKLYAAAFLPGFLLAGMYIAYVIVLAILKPNLAPPLKDDTKYSLAEVSRLLLVSFFPLALLILAVLGAIMFGIATPTEAAAVGALGGGLRGVPLADLGAAERSGVSDGAHVCDGVLVVCRFRDLCIHICLPWWRGHHQVFRTGYGIESDHLLAGLAVHHFHTRLAAGMDRDHYHFRADLSAFAAAF